MNARQALAWAGLAAAILFWAGNALIGRAFADVIPPFALGFWRWTLALLLLLPWVARPLWRARQRLSAAGWRLVLLTVLGVVGYNSLLYTAAQNTPAINITLLNTCVPLAIYLGAGLLLREWPPRHAWFGMALAAGGLLWLIAKGDPDNLLALRFSSGDLVMLLAVFDWALYSLLYKRWAPDFGLPPLVLLGAQMIIGVPILLPLYLDEWQQLGGFALTPANLSAIGYVAVFASLAAYLAWSYGLTVLGPARAGLTTYLMPVYAALLGYLLLGESLQPFHWVGGAAIFAGLLLAARPRRLS